ncbi:GNAT family N-acetyltransferase [Halobacteriales archaeon QS_3_64_16]|nr:MAG: GNAT family N-acetyltransferase [Halobacteriales archaeon QS_3_64_16]
MTIREATTEDGEAIREIAQRSMESSYSLSPRTIESAIKQWYDEEALAATLDEEDALFLIAEEEGEVVGFAQGALDRETQSGDMLWLHVDPAARGGSIGTDLFERTREELHERGAERLRGMVLEDNREGSDFYERFGFERSEERTTVIDGEPHVEFVYVEDGTEVERDPTEKDVSVPESVTTDAGEEVYPDNEDIDMGSKGPFFVVYDDADHESRYGYYCGNCGTLDTAMDAMGRVQCNDCGNLRKPTRWDAAYL